jgi:hypothetical protein
VKLPSQRFKSSEMPSLPTVYARYAARRFFGPFDGRIGAVSRRSEPAAIGRALRAGVADRSEHVPHFRDRLVRSDAGRGS